jgi:hypothetical protein
VKKRGPKLDARGWPVRIVLECGGRPATEQCKSDLAHSKTWRGFVTSLVFLASAVIAHAQSYSVDWFTIDGGGGTSTGGVYSVTGSVGQPDAGTMSGGNFTLEGGFWGVIAALQTPGAPLLSIFRTPTNTVAVSWPSPSTGWNLEQNTSSVSSVNWSNVVSVPSDNGTTKTVIVNPPSGNRFYRLFKP